MFQHKRNFNYYQLEFAKDIDDDEEEEGNHFEINIFVIFLCFILITGVIKGFLGICFKSIDQWQFDSVQSIRHYNDSGRCWKLSINSIMFFLLPISLCFKCCCCWADDHNEYEKICLKSCQYVEVDQRLFSISSEEETRSHLNFNCSSETVFEVKMMDTDQDLDDTEFIVKTINESHETLSKQSSDDFLRENFSAAQKYVDDLLKARTVYRSINTPIGGVDVDEGQSYCIRGYFIPAPEMGYQFLTFSPLKQYYKISSSSPSLIATSSDIQLDAKAFHSYYANIFDVFNTKDLSIFPTSPCVNVSFQHESMYANIE